MWLAEVVAELKTLDRDKNVAMGFSGAHSYRGYYDEIAFEPQQDTTVGAMLVCAEEAIGKTFTGWKGGDFTYSRTTPVHIAFVGRYGVDLTEEIFEFMMLEEN